MWSLGNEAGVGRNLAAMADEMRGRDATRPLHYEGDQASVDVDVWSRMYASHADVELIGQGLEPPLGDDPWVKLGPDDDAVALHERRKGMPFVLCEYVHAMGTGPGGMTEYQELFDRYPRIMGGFVWEWLEHGIHRALPDGGTGTFYGGDFGEPLHDGNFVIDGLIAADRTPRAQLADLAAVFSPVVLDLDAEAGVLRVRSPPRPHGHLAVPTELAGCLGRIVGRRRRARPRWCDAGSRGRIRSPTGATARLGRDSVAAAGCSNTCALRVWS